MRRLAALSMIAFAGPALAAPPERVVSLNLCADQYLIALLPRERVASLSPLALDTTYAYLREEAKAYPVNAGRGEAILLTGADLVFVGAFGGRARRDLLERLGFRTALLEVWSSLEQGRRQVREVAALLGVPERGEELIARIDEAWARARSIAPPRSVLVLQRRGYAPSEGSVVNEMLRHMGLKPYNERLGLAAGGAVPLERVVADPPDYLLMPESAAATVDQGSAYLAHPALTRAVPPERRLYLKDGLTICGGPSTPAALDAIAAEVRAKVR